MALATPLIAAKPNAEEKAAGAYISSQDMDVENFTRKGVKVGDYEPINVVQLFEPDFACVVDKDINFVDKLKQCKKQRLGWLKI
jgi:hypothetical protein